MTTIARTALLLVLSNVFMTFAWYAHLRDLRDRPWWIAALVSWGIALFEYLIQVPANRIGYGVLDLGQLKILQEVITLTVHPVRGPVHETTTPARLRLRRVLSAGRGLLHLPGEAGLGLRPRQILTTRRLATARGGGTFPESSLGLSNDQPCPKRDPAT